MAVVAATTIAAIRLETAEQRVAQADAPEQQALVSRVELRALREDVVVRGTVEAPDGVDVCAPEVPGAVPIVTRDIAPPGTTVQAGDVVLEVAGRPVFALPGDLPSYRDLTLGMEGPDVVQLQTALQAIGVDVRLSGRFDRATAGGVRELFERAGYAAPLSDVPQPSDGILPPVIEQVPMLPRSQVVYIAVMPAYVAATSAERGQSVADEAAALSVAGGPPVLAISVSEAQAEIVRPGAEAVLTLDDGSILTATVFSVATEPSDSDAAVPSFGVVAGFSNPVDLSLVGGNFPVAIAVAATDGAVLAVPIAAVFSRADGSVFVQRVDPRSGEPRQIGIVPGPVVGGYVEVRSADERLQADDEVVIGFPSDS